MQEELCAYKKISKKVKNDVGCNPTETNEGLLDKIQRN